MVIGDTALHFSPYAWAKLLHFRDKASNEVSGFGITKKDNPLYVEDFLTVEQEVTSATVAFDDEAIGEFYEKMAEKDYNPSQFGRIWIHTHPGFSASPSSTDTETFNRAFGASYWAILFVIGTNNTVYARLQYNFVPPLAVHIPVYIDYSEDFSGVSEEVKTLWDEEYEANVTEKVITTVYNTTGTYYSRQTPGTIYNTDLTWQDYWTMFYDKKLTIWQLRAIWIKMWDTMNEPDNLLALELIRDDILQLAVPEDFIEDCNRPNLLDYDKGYKTGLELLREEETDTQDELEEEERLLATEAEQRLYPDHFDY